MTTFQKLNLKEQKSITVVNGPASFEPELATLKGLKIERKLGAAEIEFVLAFVIKQSEVDALAKTIGKKAKGDAVVWFAYPKGSSKNYKSEIKRDSGWKFIGEAGFEPVRMVAIDADWSAVRFRRVEFIENMTRPRDVRLTGKKK